MDYASGSEPPATPKTTWCLGRDTAEQGCISACSGGIWSAHLRPAGRRVEGCQALCNWLVQPRPRSAVVLLGSCAMSSKGTASRQHRRYNKGLWWSAVVLTGPPSPSAFETLSWDMAPAPEVPRKRPAPFSWPWPCLQERQPGCAPCSSRPGQVHGKRALAPVSVSGCWFPHCR